MKVIPAKMTLLLILVMVSLSACKDLWHPEGPSQEKPIQSSETTNDDTGITNTSPGRVEENEANLNITRPGTPTGVKAVAISYDIIRITWNPVSDATGYKVYHGPAGISDPVLSTAVSTNTLDFTGLTQNSSYFYKVSSVNSAGEGIASGIVSTQTHSSTLNEDNENKDSPDTTLPEKETSVSINITATVLSSNSIRLSWNPVQGATSYRIYEGSAGSNPIIWNHYSITTTSTSHIFTNLFPSSTYSYRVVAIGSTSQGSTFPTVSARTSSSTTIPGSSHSNAIRLTSYTYGSFPAGMDAVWYVFTRHGRGQITGLGREYSSTFTGDIIVDIYNSNLNLITIDGRLQSDINLGWRNTIFNNWSGTYYIRVRPRGGLNSNKGSFLLDPFYG